MPAVAIVLVLGVIGVALAWQGFRSQSGIALHRSSIMPFGWVASRGPAGIAILVVILLLLVFAVLRLPRTVTTGRSSSAASFVVAVASFTVSGGAPGTGVTVADQLLRTLPLQTKTPATFVRVAEAVTTPDAALIAAQRVHATVLIWGEVQGGALADEPALRPNLVWSPPPTWAPHQWIGSEQWAFGGHYQLSRVPLNGTVVLPPLLESLALVQNGSLDEALTRLDTLRRDYGDVINNELPASLQSLLYWATGLNAEAEVAARVALAADSNAATNNNLAVVLTEAGRDDEAVTALNQALTHDPQSPRPHANRGRLLVAGRDPAAAVVDLRSAVDAGDATALPYLAAALREAGAFTAARDAATRALARDPEQPLALSERAILALTDVQTATGRLEWQLEAPQLRTPRQLQELHDQLQTVLNRDAATRRAALQSAAGAGAAGQPSFQRLQEMQARRIERRRPRLEYAALLVAVEGGRVGQRHTANSASRFVDWLRGKHTPLQVAAELASTLASQATTPLLRYNATYQGGRARYLDDQPDAARTAWNEAAALTNTVQLARQPDVPFAMSLLLQDAAQNSAARRLLEQALVIAPEYLPARRSLLDLAQQAGRWADADTHLRYLMSHSPGEATTLQMADVLVKEGRSAEAEALLLPLANDGHSRALIALAALYRSSGQWDAARQVLDRALTADPRDPAVYEERAALAQQQPQPDLAAADTALHRAVTLAPGRQSAHVALARLLMQEGQSAAAVKEFQAAVAINSNDPLVYRQLGELLLQSGQRGPAADSFRRSLRLAPNSHESHHGLATAYLAQNRLDDAQAEEQKTLELAHNNYTLAEIGLGDIERARGHLDLAVKHYEKALTQDPAVAGAFYGLGAVALKQNVPELALRHFEHGLAANPNDSRLLLGSAAAQLQNGNPAAAEQIYRQTLALNPTSAAAYAGVGQALWKQGRNAEALNQLKQAVQRDPNDADSWLAMGEIEATAGQLQNASDDYAHAARVRPEWDLPHYRRGVLLVEKAQPAAALPDLQAAVRLNDAYPQSHYWLARDSRALGDLSSAERQLRRAIDLDPNYYEARYFLGRVLVERGKRSDARPLFQALVKDAPQNDQWRAEATRELARLPAQ
ncbi:MAG: hypothetical protein NVS2B7_21320 [Herpetosiphon sp.]